MTEIVHKVAAYIICEDKLLVFSHADFPEAGIQIPSGTAIDGEDFDEAVLREAYEETGLDDLRIVSFLGTKVYDMRPIDGSERNIHRHYYHLMMLGSIKADKWQHWEEDPSEGAKEPIPFEMFWVKIPEDIPELSGSQSDMLFHIIPDA